MSVPDHGSNSGGHKEITLQQNTARLIASTYGDNLSARIEHHGTVYHGTDVTGKVDFDDYISSLSIPVNLYAFSFDDLPLAQSYTVTAYDKSQKYASVPLELGTKCAGYSALVEPLGVSLRTDYDFSVPYDVIDSDSSISQRQPVFAPVDQSEDHIKLQDDASEGAIYGIPQSEDGLHGMQTDVDTQNQQGGADIPEMTLEPEPEPDLGDPLTDTPSQQSETQDWSLQDMTDSFLAKYCGLCEEIMHDWSLQDMTDSFLAFLHSGIDGLMNKIS